MTPTNLLREQHALALLYPVEFAMRMNQYWTSPRPDGLGLCSSPVLMNLWRIMGETFQLATVEAASGVQSPWRILQPPTGTGKTQGACVYAAMQVCLNHGAEGTQLKPVGIIIVTRLKEDADTIRKTINTLAGRDVAVVHHSDSYAKPEQLYASDVVVITHAAFIKAKRDTKGRDWKAWDRLVSWRGGERHLTIIDEALANVVDESHATTENLGFVISLIPPELRSAFPQQVGVLEQVHRVLVAFADPDDHASPMSMIWGEGGAPVDADFAPFISAMATLPYDQIVYARSNTKDRTQLAERVADTITTVQTCLEQFAYYSRSGDWHSINTASLAVPLDAPGPVVMDATARANFLWDLFGERHRLIPVPSHARDYSSVTLHVARGGGVGKNTMIEKLNERLPRIKKGLEEAIGPERSVFLCVHKDVEAVITKKSKNGGDSWIEKLPFKQCSIGHWGAVDGRNTWQDYDTAVILGLPYLPQTWATNMFCALQGAQDDEWLQSPEWKQYKNVRQVMEQRQMSVSVIQAVNRIRCRKVVDADGRCPPADIFIVLPKDAFGDAVLDDIKTDMPGIKVTDWAFALDAPKDKKPRIGSSHARLISYMEKQVPGPVSLTVIQRDIQLPSLKKLRETLNNSEHPATRALRERKVSYLPGVGRGSKSYLVKAA